MKAYGEWTMLSQLHSHIEVIKIYDGTATCKVFGKLINMLVPSFSGTNTGYNTNQR
jgi:hypothetical protein